MMWLSRRLGLAWGSGIPRHAPLCGLAKGANDGNHLTKRRYDDNVVHVFRVSPPLNSPSLPQTAQTVCPPARLSLCLSVPLSVCLSVTMSACQSVYVSGFLMRFFGLRGEMDALSQN